MLFTGAVGAADLEFSAFGEWWRPVLMHLSVPGQAQDDSTAFSRTKRAGERLIAGSGLPYLILRPSFVVVPAGFGGGALIRARAALPLTVSRDMGARPFAAISMDDIARTVSVVSARWAVGGGRPGLVRLMGSVRARTP